MSTNSRHVSFQAASDCQRYRNWPPPSLLSFVPTCVCVRIGNSRGVIVGPWLTTWSVEQSTFREKGELLASRWRSSNPSARNLSVTTSPARSLLSDAYGSSAPAVKSRRQLGSVSKAS